MHELHLFVLQPAVVVVSRALARGLIRADLYGAAVPMVFVATALTPPALSGSQTGVQA